MGGYVKLLVAIVVLSNVHCVERGEKVNKADPNESRVDSYTMKDFDKVEKIDVHVHVNGGETVMEMAKQHNFKLLNISFDYPENPPLEEQQILRREQLKERPDVMAFSTYISLEGWDDVDWSDKAIKQLGRDFDLGANSVKTWKNIGMEFKDRNGELIFLDDAKLDPVFQFMEKQGKVLLTHAGEPRNCWLPLDSMTVKNDRDYFSAHPQYHMYLHPEKPSYEEQIAHRDSALAKHPDLSFVALHLASLEWSTDEVADFLDRFPNGSVDLAERISHLQYQSQINRNKVIDFIVKYQDRILYATDFQENEHTDEGQIKEYMMGVWANDWRYFNTEEIFTVPQLDRPVKGLGLPKEVVDKIYRSNAERLFPDSWK
ncbi:amidohydrolase family protein [Muricauda sp. ANG21]|uniref:amidohydrolase family protein n=1 Tax=Allomuricauda sp. ANG21 TaxID=3042468 RepID=UPI0034568629